MKLTDIEKGLPNGFHDALLQRISVDYSTRKATINFKISLGDPSSIGIKASEAYREGQLTLHNLVFCAIDPPDPNSEYLKPKHLLTDAGPLRDLKLPSAQRLSELLPEGAFIHWFFVSNWNAFIYVAAMDATFEWV